MCVCHYPKRSSRAKVAKTSFLCLGDVQMGQLGAAQHLINDSCVSTLTATQSNSLQTTEKTLFVSHRSLLHERSCCVMWRARREYKRQMNCLCFPFCLFKYWNTKSFQREIMLRGLQSKWDSLHEKQILSNPRVWVGVCLCYKCKACWDWFLQSSCCCECFNAGLMCILKVHGGGAAV